MGRRRSGAGPRGLLPGGMLLVLLVLQAVPVLAEEGTATWTWRTHYGDAMAEARDQGAWLAVVFIEDPPTAAQQAWLAEVAGHPVAEKVADEYVWVQVGVSTEIDVDGETTRLLDHGAFRHLLGGPGLALIDVRDEESEHYSRVVSVYPFRDGDYPDSEAISVLLDLPDGTLTQRTMIFAVRTHPERPASTNGEFSPVLAEEAESHAVHQARINLQGHHNWDARFHRINGRLGRGLVANEVCAESWPGEGLLEAARECVRSWRYSSGHWRLVNGSHAAFGYDMKRGSNGVWYGTGIFGSRR